MKEFKKMRVCAALMTLMLLVAAPALAHKVNIFAYAEDGKVYCESYFPDGKKVQNGTVEVRNSKGEILLTGKTDTQGNFSFKAPPPQDLTIVLIATMGHRNTFLLKKEEME